MKRLFLLMAVLCGVAVMRAERQNVIFETDMGNDVDDALAIDMLFGSEYQDQKANIYGCVEKSISALNTYLEFINRGLNVLNGSQSGAKDKDAQKRIPDGAMLAVGGTLSGNHPITGGTYGPHSEIEMTNSGSIQVENGVSASIYNPAQTASRPQPEPGSTTLQSPGWMKTGCASPPGGGYII